MMVCLAKNADIPRAKIICDNKQKLDRETENIHHRYVCFFFWSGGGGSSGLLFGNIKKKKMDINLGDARTKSVSRRIPGSL